MAAKASVPAGAPAGEEGLVNPHIPEFMAKAPWYLQQGNDKGLAHQRRGEVEDQSIANLEKYYAHRGQKVSAANSYRKGACKNCGSATHNEKQCTERPRKVGAWKTGSQIAQDEALPSDLRLGWDAKRDRYAGYDADEHMKVIAKHETIEAERKRFEEEAKQKAAQEAAQKRAEKEAKRVAKATRRAAREARAAHKAAKAAAGGDGASTDSDAGAGGAGAGAGKGEEEDFSSTDDEDGDWSDSEGEEGGAGGGGAGAGGQAKMVSWNVRTREDTAKYLLNLDTESAFYDPKTRSMRENPFAPGDPRAAQFGYEGDNANKESGAVADMASDQLFAWEAYNRGSDVHLQADPTRVALLKKQFAQRKEAVKALVAKKLADKYGGSAVGEDGDVEAAEALPEELRLAGVAESERYHEYMPALAPDGRVVPVPVQPGTRGANGRPGAGAGAGSGAGEEGSTEDGSGPGSGPGSSSGPARSRYPEDVHPGNHTSIYGSWFDTQSKSWGFSCCHQTLYGSYCTGQAGKTARSDALDFATKSAAVHAAAIAERSALGAKRALEAEEGARQGAAEDDARARKRARAEDPLTQGGASAGAGGSSSSRTIGAGATGYGAQAGTGSDEE